MSAANGDNEASGASWQRPDAPLGTLIFREGLLSAEQLEDALGESVKRGKRLGQVLVERGLLDESQVARVLARQKGLDYVDLRETPVDPEAAALLGSETAWLTHAVPVTVTDGTPLVAIEDPGDEQALKTVADALGTKPHFAVATRSEILRVLSTVFEEGGTAPPAAAPLTQPPPLQQVPPPEPEPTPEPSAPARVADTAAPAEPAPQPTLAEVNGLRVAAPPPEPEPAPEPEAVASPPEPEPEPEPEPGRGRPRARGRA